MTSSYTTDQPLLLLQWYRRRPLMQDEQSAKINRAISPKLKAALAKNVSEIR